MHWEEEGRMRVGKKKGRMRAGRRRGG